MRPFFSYYGSKWIAAGYMAAPRCETVVEPFAGSAAYSLRYNVRRAILVDKSEDICSLWDFLIHASEADIAGLPDALDSNDDLAALPDGPRQLVGLWVAKGRAEVSNVLSPWYIKYRNAKDCRVWGPPVKRRIISQLDGIRGWRIIHGDYTEAPDIAAHWHVDPPYSGPPGRRYPHSDIDYEALSAWCASRKGFLQVCENVGADWMPFEPLCDVVSSRGRRDGSRSAEAVLERWQT